MGIISLDFYCFIQQDAEDLGYGLQSIYIYHLQKLSQ